ncbi:MAG: AAA family ATPase, partial [Actinomycetota bacterium]
MRPHELTLRGFRSYRDEVTFDFRGRHLVGIVGPIGAGKSSILDGIAFALFGKTPRVQKETKSLIHQLSDSAHVRLTFEVDGQTWQVTRALKRKGQGQVQLVHLGDVGEAVETVVMERPVRDRIERLLGMDFDTFGRSVLLAQNRFAEFLLASDAPRNAVLKGVFGYERFDAALTAAREHVARREATVAALDADGARLTQARAALEEARTAAADAVARRDRFEALLPRVADLDRHVAAAAEREATAATAAARVERAAAMVPDAATLDDTLTATEAAHEAAARASAAVDDAAAARAATEAERDAATERIGDLQAFADLVAQLDTRAKAVTTTAATQTRAVHDAETAATAAAAALEADVAARDALSSATETVAVADARLAEADDTLHAARHAEMAAELRGGLAANEPCPVCAQVVTVVPKAGKAAGIKAAERARAAAAKRHDTDARTRDRAAVSAANAAATAAATGTVRDRLAAASAVAEAGARQAEAELAAT